ncbi:MAG: MotA/TolQ/ExbB proton channel family protein [Lentisphaeria bacterium]|jgi:biopolymer transport protein ExbB
MNRTSMASWAAAVAAILTATAGGARAQELAAAESPITGVDFTSVSSLVIAGGWTMYVIIGMSVIALFLAFYYLFTLRPVILYPAVLLRNLEAAATQGDLAGMRNLCHESKAPVARIIESTLEQMEMAGGANSDAIRTAMEDEGSRQANVLWQRIQYLLDVAVVAPMVGLLGTVLGMIQSFANLQAEVGGVVIPTAMAQGVAKALITTAGGLMVGIPAMLVYALFRGRVTALIAGMELACSRVLRRLCATLSHAAAKPG